MPDRDEKIFVVDDSPKAPEFFGTQNLQGAYIPIFEDESRVTFKSVSDKLSRLTPEDNIKLVLVNAHFGKNNRWRFQGINLVWSMRGCAKDGNAIGKHNPHLLTIPVIIYSILHRKYLEAHSIHEFGQSIFNVPYRPGELCKPLFLITDKSVLQKQLNQSVSKLVKNSQISLQEDVRLNTHPTRRKFAIEAFIREYRHEKRSELHQLMAKPERQVWEKIENGFNSALGKAQAHALDGEDLLKDEECKIRPLIQGMEEDINSHELEKVRKAVEELNVELEAIIDTSGSFTTYTMFRGRSGKKIRLHVLIIEDDPETGEYYKSYLKSVSDPLFNFSPEFISHDWEKGTLDILTKNIQRNSNVIIILDLILDRWRDAGLNILKRVKSDDKFKNVKVMIITARNDVQSQALSYGADYYLTKPVAGESMIKEVKRLYYEHTVALIPNNMTQESVLSLLRPGLQLSKSNVDQFRLFVEKWFAQRKIKVVNLPPIHEDNIDQTLLQIDDCNADLVILDCLSLEKDKCFSTQTEISLFKRIKTQTLSKPPIFVLLPTGSLKNKLIFDDLYSYFGIGVDEIKIGPYFDYRLMRDIAKGFKSGGLTQLNIRYTLILQTTYQDTIQGKEVEIVIPANELEEYRLRIALYFRGSTISKPEGDYYSDEEKRIIADKNFKIEILTRYRPAQKAFLIHLLREFKHRYKQEVMFLQDERISNLVVSD
jgi:response regulator of citrate/malate metabolism